jgi:hypothetical protein
VAPEALRDLLSTLREFGVSEYQTPELRLILGGTPKPAHVPRPGEDAFDSELTEPDALPDLDDEDGEPGNFLERIAAANRKKAAR